MPIEVRELVIKAVVDHASQRKPDESPQRGGNGNTGDKKLEETLSQILELIKEDKNER
ncbi:MAG: hypothetical protein KDD36_05620 [Flavobacteriales bacterium]|nr:hypothetical protein [Flavobacteriales bacterium]